MWLADFRDDFSGMEFLLLRAGPSAQRSRAVGFLGRPLNRPDHVFVGNGEAALVEALTSPGWHSTAF